MDPFLYQYAIGGIVFGVGLYFGFRHGYLGLSGRPLLMLLGVLGVLGILMGAQGFLQYGDMTTLPQKAYAGGAERREILGTPLDYAIMVGYFIAILVVGTFFGRRQKSVKDFFFGGQRFSWWLIAFSMVATVVGSYSFVKYSRVAYTYGIASSQTYLNDWFWMPLLAFGWLPLLYFSRITSIPEYFERRFNRQVRFWVTLFMLVYLVGYVGVNLFTMGKALNILLGWHIWAAAVLVAVVSAIYVTFGGQTSVIMTDLLQGVMLLCTGLVILWLGADYLGGVGTLWQSVPRELRQAFPNYNTDPSYNAVGVFWQDGMANNAMFYLLNQGIIMRFLAAKSVPEARKAILTVPLVLMPIAAAVVASGGWVGRALVQQGVLPPDIRPDEVFFITAEFLSHPGVFGLIMAALTAALMSTVDSLITAVAAVVVNDLYIPYIKPKASGAELLKVARMTSIAVTLVGIALVPLFMTFKSIYAAHGAFTASVTPPLVVAFLLSVFWRRYSATAALWTLIGGMAAIVFSLFVPEVITPFAHGVPIAEVDPGFLSGMKQYKYMRAFYGLVVSLAIALAVTPFTKPESMEKMRGLVWGTIMDALRGFLGKDSKRALALTAAAGGAQAAVGTMRLAAALGPEADPDLTQAEDPAEHLPPLGLSQSLADSLGVAVGDTVYVSDQRWFLGGLRSGHGRVFKILATDGPALALPPVFRETVVAKGREDKPLWVERLY